MLPDPSSYYMRDPRVVAVTTDSRLILVSERGDVLEHATTDTARWSAWLQAISTPLSGVEVGELSATIPDLDERLFRELVEVGYVAAGPDRDGLLAQREQALRQSPGLQLDATDPVCDHLVVACTGSVVAGLIAPTILSLRLSGFQRDLDVVLTKSAQRFLTRDLLEAYGVRTWTDMFERREHVNVPHVQLARSADCIVVLPATANAMSRIASGACSDLLSLIVAATTAPVVLVPAMNDAMWNHRAVQRNVEQLREDGMYIVEPTLIFGAADVPAGPEPMFGGHGTLWAGPQGLRRAVAAILSAAGA